MNLQKKKLLAARALKVGKNKIIFNPSRLEEIKSAITKQDVKDLFNSNAIFIRDLKGRRKIRKRKYRRKSGSIRKKLGDKDNYILLVRKLRNYLSSLKNKELISQETYYRIRKEIKANAFKDLSHLKLEISELPK